MAEAQVALDTNNDRSNHYSPCFQASSESKQPPSSARHGTQL